MEAIILAGGLGTRLQSVVSHVPKPMAPIGDKPFLQYILDDLARQGICDIVLAVGYKNESVSSYFGCRYGGMDIRYSLETEPLGTGGAIQTAARQVQGEHVLVVNGDTLFRIDIHQLACSHLERRADLTLSLKAMNHFDRYGAVKLDSDGRILSFEEKRFYEHGFINGGIYMCKTEWVRQIARPARFSFEQYLQETALQPHRMFGFPSEGYFMDIGIPDDYRRAVAELTGKHAAKEEEA